MYNNCAEIVAFIFGMSVAIPTVFIPLLRYLLSEGVIVVNTSYLGSNLDFNVHIFSDTPEEDEIQMVEMQNRAKPGII